MKPKKKRRAPKTLTATLYCYVEPVNGKRAKQKGAEFGSFSNYVNFLIARDAQDKASMARSRAIAERYLTPRTRKPAKAKRAKKTLRQAKGKTSRKVKVQAAPATKKKVSRPKQFVTKNLQGSQNHTSAKKVTPKLRVNHVKKVLQNYKKATKPAQVTTSTAA